MDRADVTLEGVKAIRLDLSDKASIDAAVDECGGPVDALFSCAGVADGTPGIERINFIGHRHLIDRMLAGDMLPRGSAIGLISSAAGLGWEDNLELLGEFLDITDFDAAAQWAQEREKATLHLVEAGHQRLRRPRGLRPAEAGHPHQRHPPRADRHAARPGQQGAVARVRLRLPRRGRRRGVDARSSRRTRWCSSAARPPRASPASPSSPTPGTSPPASAGRSLRPSSPSPSSAASTARSVDGWSPRPDRTTRPLSTPRPSPGSVRRTTTLDMTAARRPAWPRVADVRGQDVRDGDCPRPARARVEIDPSGDDRGWRRRRAGRRRPAARLRPAPRRSARPSTVPVGRCAAARSTTSAARSSCRLRALPRRRLTAPTRHRASMARRRPTSASAGRPARRCSSRCGATA